MATKHKAPGKNFREGLTLIQVMDMFPDEVAAAAWFESIYWPNGRCCGKCGSMRTREASHAKMPYWCSDCRSYFSVKTGTPLANSKVPLRKWAIAIYLCLTSLKSVSSMKLHRDIGVSQPTAWFMLHRIREAWMPKTGGGKPFEGPVEADETYMGGKRKNMRPGSRHLAFRADGNGHFRRSASARRCDVGDAFFELCPLFHWHRGAPGLGPDPLTHRPPRHRRRLA